MLTSYLLMQHGHTVVDSRSWWCRENMNEHAVTSAQTRTQWRGSPQWSSTCRSDWLCWEDWWSTGSWSCLSAQRWSGPLTCSPPATAGLPVSNTETQRYVGRDADTWTCCVVISCTHILMRVCRPKFLIFGYRHVLQLFLLSAHGEDGLHVVEMK